MTIYNKLVRDKIPQVISQKGETPKTRTLGRDEFIIELNKKLQEEVDEYLASNTLEELADIVEVIHGILAAQDKSFEILEVIRLEKKEKRGGFEERVFLESVEEGG